MYVGDIIIIGTHASMIKYLQTLLHYFFHMKDLGPLTFFLGLKVHQSAKDIFINQHKYIVDLIEMADLQKCTPVDTSLEVNGKLSKDDGDLLRDPMLYKRLASTLVYLTVHGLTYPMQPIHECSSKSPPGYYTSNYSTSSWHPH